MRLGGPRSPPCGPQKLPQDPVLPALPKDQWFPVAFISLGAERKIK